MKKYSKLLKTLFTNYSNTGYKNKGMDKFDKCNEEKITNPELWKLLRDHNVDQLLSKEEFSTLIRLVNSKLCKKNDIYDLDSDGFNKFIIQVAMLITNRQPINLTH